jgi:hypothetical protein
MKKYIRKHLKDEKRILKLMYRKGIFKLLDINIESLCWEYLCRGKRLRKREGKRKYSYNEYLPELHTYYSDYWGDGDSKSVIDSFKDYLFWENAKSFNENGFPLDTKYFKSDELIKYLSELPTKIHDSKFNGILNRSPE